MEPFVHVLLAILVRRNFHDEVFLTPQSRQKKKDIKVKDLILKKLLIKLFDMKDLSTIQ